MTEELRIREELRDVGKDAILLNPLESLHECFKQLLLVLGKELYLLQNVDCVESVQLTVHFLLVFEVLR